MPTVTGCTSSQGRILVTGGAGFIGANLVRMLVSRGYEVVVLDNLETGSELYIEGLPVDCVVGDVLDEEMLFRLVPGTRAVVHLAGQTGVPRSVENPRTDCTVNVLGTLNILEVCRNVAATQGADEAPRVVFASSNAPLGRQEPPAVETKAPLPVSPYGASKLAAEGYCLAYNGSWELPTVVLRFSNVYGPFSAHKDSVVSKFFKDFERHGRIAVYGDGEQTRDFIFVEDLCRAILLAVDSSVVGEVLQIATGTETTIAELVRKVAETVGAELEVEHRSPRRGDVRKNYSRITKATEMLGWCPGVSLECGLKRTWDWFTAWQSLAP